ncbi:MAG: hypothetical protein FD167_522 [bacterium]|nr:MAG: hypothetical protein FD167_522 [bacterium]
MIPITLAKQVLPLAQIENPSPSQYLGEGYMSLATGEHLDGNYTEFFLNVSEEELTVIGLLHINGSGSVKVYARMRSGETRYLATITGPTTAPYVISPNQPVDALMVDPLTDVNFTWDLYIRKRINGQPVLTLQENNQLMNAGIPGIGQTGQDLLKCPRDPTKARPIPTTFYKSTEDIPSLVQFTGYLSFYDPTATDNKNKVRYSECLTDTLFEGYDKNYKSLFAVLTKGKASSTKTIAGKFKLIDVSAGFSDPDADKDTYNYFSWTIK